MPAESPLQPVPAHVLARFDVLAPSVERAVVRQCLEEEGPPPELGPDAPERMLRGMGFVTRMLHTAMGFSAAEILADEVAWGSDRLPVYGVEPRTVLDNFRRYDAVLGASMAPEDYAHIRPWLHWLMERWQQVALE